MNLTRPIAGAVGLALAAAWPVPAPAHSLAELAAGLGQYFQAKDQEAPGFELRDAAGRPVRLADFLGKVVVLNFIYTNCPDVCPLHAERIAEVQEMVNRAGMKDRVQFISVTTDPARDTAEAMAAYGPAHGLDPANWLFLRSGNARPEDATRKLARRFGHTFTPTDDGDQIHGVVTHVIDQDGRWRGNFHGLKFQPTDLVLFINALSNGTARPHHHDGHGFWDWLWRMF